MQLASLLVLFHWKRCSLKTAWIKKDIRIRYLHIKNLSYFKLGKIIFAWILGIRRPVLIRYYTYLRALLTVYHTSSASRIIGLALFETTGL